MAMARAWRMGAAVTAGALLLAGCGADCLELKRSGDFEYSQGNYANAIRHYERALAADSLCAGVAEKLQEARSRNK